MKSTYLWSLAAGAVVLDVANDWRLWWRGREDAVILVALGESRLNVLWEMGQFSILIAKHVGRKRVREFVTYGWDDNWAVDDLWHWHDDLVIGDCETGLDLVLDDAPWAQLARVDQESGMAAWAGAELARSVDVAAPDGLGHVLAHCVLSTVFDTHIAGVCGHWGRWLWKWFVVDGRQRLVEVKFRGGICRERMRYWDEVRGEGHKS